MVLLAEQTGLSEACLNRLRWFAFRFSSYEEFRASHSDVNSWDKVCLLLVEISHKEKTADAASSGPDSRENGPSKEVQALLRSLKAMASAMPVKRIPVDDDVLDDIETGLRKFRRALNRCTGLNVTISIAPASEVVAS